MSRFLRRIDIARPIAKTMSGMLMPTLTPTHTAVFLPFDDEICSSVFESVVGWERTDVIDVTIAVMLVFDVVVLTDTLRGTLTEGDGEVAVIEVVVSVGSVVLNVAGPNS